MRILTAAIAGLSLATVATPASADCFRNCFTFSDHKPSSVIPSDFVNQFGDLFRGQFSVLNVTNDRAVQVSLGDGFRANIGGLTFSSLFVSENGAVSFGAPILGTTPAPAEEAVFVPVTSLSQLGAPVIAPFYRNLFEDGTRQANAPQPGQVVVEYGFSDPTADLNGRYSANDILQAIRITWYGLALSAPAASLAPGEDGALVDYPAAFAQLLLTNEGNGDFNFEFRSGDPTVTPFSQPGYDSIAGFALPGGSFQFTGPYGNGSPSYFVFRDGVFQGFVPEPATWGMMIAGLGMIGGATRTRRRVAAVTAAC